MAFASRVGIGAAALALAASAACGGTLVLDLNYEFSGASSPAGLPPWARATFTDMPAGKVQLKMEVMLSGVEFAAKNQNNGWHFNFDPAKNSSLLSIAQVAGRTASFNSGNDAFSADGGGKYDMVFWFAGAGPVPDGLNSTAGNTSSTVLLSHSSLSLTVADFDFVSAPQGGNGVWKSALHVQGIGGGGAGSGWIGPRDFIIPLPSAGAMGLAGLGIIAARRRVR